MTNTSSSNKKKLTPGTAAIVGGFAASAEITCAYPVEFTKVIMQLYSKYNKLGMGTVIRETIKKDGFFGLYKGYNLLLVAAIPKAYVRFGTFEAIKQNYLTANTVLNTTIAGGVAGALEGLFVHTPVENMKVKLIHDRFKEHPQFRNMFHGIYKVSKEQGFNGMTAGALITTIKEGSNHAIRFPLFLGLQAAATPYIKNSVLRDTLMGVTTGIICVAINQPVDVVKTNMQGLDRHLYKGTVDCARQIWRQSGFWGFYRGVNARMARVAIEVGVTFASYNAIRDTVLSYLEAAD